MEKLNLNMIVIIILMLAMIITGILLSRKGKPYSNLVLTLHKLISLAFIVLGVIEVFKLGKAEFDYAQSMIIPMLAAVLIIISFISGALLSIEKTSTTIMKLLHKFGSLLVLIITAYLIYTITSQTGLIQ